MGGIDGNWSVVQMWSMLGVALVDRHEYRMAMANGKRVEVKMQKAGVSSFGKLNRGLDGVISLR